MPGDVVKRYLELVVEGNYAGHVGEKVAKDLQGAETSWKKLASTVTSAGVGVGVVAAGIGVESVRSASSFNDMLMKVGNNTAMSTKQIDQMRQGVLKLGSEGPAKLDDIAAGFEHVSNVMNLQGKQAMPVVTAAWKSAIETGASVGDTANALATAMGNFHEPARNAAKDMGFLMDAAARGNIRLQDLVTSFSKVGVTAASIHMPFQSALAAYSALTKATGSASQAQTLLVGMMTHMISPTKAATDMLDAMGSKGVALIGDFKQFAAGQIPFIQVMRDVRDVFPQATGNVKQLTSEFGKYQAGQITSAELSKDVAKQTNGVAGALFKLFGGLRGGLGALTLLGPHWKDYLATNKQINGSQDLLNKQWARTSKEFSFMSGTIGNDAKILEIQIGQGLIPALKEMMPPLETGIKDLGHLMNDFPGGSKRLVEFGLAIGGISVALKAVTFFGKPAYNALANVLGLGKKGVTKALGKGAAATAIQDLTPHAVSTMNVEAGVVNVYGKTLGGGPPGEPVPPGAPGETTPARAPGAEPGGNVFDPKGNLRTTRGGPMFEDFMQAGRFGKFIRGVGVIAEIGGLVGVGTDLFATPNRKGRMPGTSGAQSSSDLLSLFRGKPVIGPIANWVAQQNQFATGAQHGKPLIAPPALTDWPFGPKNTPTWWKGIQSRFGPAPNEMPGIRRAVQREGGRQVEVPRFVRAGRGQVGGHVIYPSGQSIPVGSDAQARHIIRSAQRAQSTVQDAPRVHEQAVKSAATAHVKLMKAFENAAPQAKFAAQTAAMVQVARKSYTQIGSHFHGLMTGIIQDEAQHLGNKSRTKWDEWRLSKLRTAQKSADEMVKSSLHEQEGVLIHARMEKDKRIQILTEEAVKASNLSQKGARAAALAAISQKESVVKQGIEEKDKRLQHMKAEALAVGNLGHAGAKRAIEAAIRHRIGVIDQAKLEASNVGKHLQHEHNEVVRLSASGAKKAIEEKLKQRQGVVKHSLEEAKGAINAATTEKKGINQALSDLGVKVPKVFDSMSKGAVKSLSDMNTQTNAQAHSLTQGVLTKFQSLQTQLVGHSVVPDTSRAVVRNFTTMQSQSVSQAVLLNNKFIAQMKDMSSKSGDTLKSMMGNIQHILSSGTKNAYKDGADITKAFAQGLSSGLGGVKTAVKKINAAAVLTGSTSSSSDGLPTGGVGAGGALNSFIKFGDKFAEQCTALATHWLQKIGRAGDVPIANFAYQWTKSKAFHPGTKGLAPGDVLVWKQNSVEGISGAGHVDIFYKFGRKNGQVGYYTWDANWGPNSNEGAGTAPQMVWHPLSDVQAGVAGYLNVAGGIGGGGGGRGGGVGGGGSARAAAAASVAGGAGSRRGRYRATGYPPIPAGLRGTPAARYWHTFVDAARNNNVPVGVLLDIAYHESSLFAAGGPGVSVMGGISGPGAGAGIAGAMSQINYAAGLISSYHLPWAQALSKYNVGGPGGYTGGPFGYGTYGVTGRSRGSTTGATSGVESGVDVVKKTAIQLAEMALKQVNNQLQALLKTPIPALNTKGLKALMELTHKKLYEQWHLTYLEINKWWQSLSKQQRHDPSFVALYKARKDAAGAASAQARREARLARTDLPLQRQMETLQYRQKSLTMLTKDEKPWAEGKKAQDRWLKREFMLNRDKMRYANDEAKLQLEQHKITKAMYEQRIKADRETLNQANEDARFKLTHQGRTRSQDKGVVVPAHVIGNCAHEGAKAAARDHARRHPDRHPASHGPMADKGLPGQREREGPNMLRAWDRHVRELLKEHKITQATARTIMNHPSEWFEYHWRQTHGGRRDPASHGPIADRGTGRQEHEGRNMLRAWDRRVNEMLKEHKITRATAHTMMNHPAEWFERRWLREHRPKVTGGVEAHTHHHHATTHHYHSVAGGAEAHHHTHHHTTHARHTQTYITQHQGVRSRDLNGQAIRTHTRAIVEHTRRTAMEVLGLRQAWLNKYVTGRTVAGAVQANHYVQHHHQGGHTHHQNVRNYNTHHHHVYSSPIGGPNAHDPTGNGAKTAVATERTANATEGLRGEIQGLRSDLRAMTAALTRAPHQQRNTNPKVSGSNGYGR